MKPFKENVNYLINRQHFNEISNSSLYSALKLRSDVFVVEQNCVYPDLDNKDTHPDTIHILCEALDKSKTAAAIHNMPPILAYARCLAPGISYSGSSIGRVVVSSEARGRGLAKSLMLEAIKTCTQRWPEKDIQIGAQVYLQEFYTQLGFRAFSKPYDEDGIMHIDMQYKFTD